MIAVARTSVATEIQVEEARKEFSDLRDKLSQQEVKEGWLGSQRGGGGRRRK